MHIGQDQQRARFSEAAQSGRLHHAWLLAGPRGMGKRGFADWAAAMLLGAEAAALVAADAHPDLRIVAPDAEARATRTIGVDAVRALAPLLRTHPAMGRHRIVIVDAADDLGVQASNALLKLLEEPGQNSVFLLVSHAPGRLLATIRSRCRTVRFPPLPEAEIMALLAARAPGCPPDRRAAIARLARGSPGEALELAQGEALSLLEAIEQEPPHTLARTLSAAGQTDRFALFCSLVPRLIADWARETGKPALVDLQMEAAALAVSAVPLALDRAPVAFALASSIATARKAR